MNAMHAGLGLSMGMVMGLLVGWATLPAAPAVAPPPPVTPAKVAAAAPLPPPPPACSERDALRAQLDSLRSEKRWPAKAGDPRILESQLRSAAQRIADDLEVRSVTVDCAEYPCVAVFAVSGPEAATELAHHVRRHMGQPLSTASEHHEAHRLISFAIGTGTDRDSANTAAQRASRVLQQHR